MRYRVHAERTTVELAVVEIELPEGVDPEEVDWPDAIEEHFDSEAERPGAPVVEWSLDDVIWDVEQGTDYEEVA